MAQRLLGIARRPGRGPNAGVADAELEERFVYVPFAPKDYSEHSVALDDLFQAVADLRPLSCLYPRLSDGRDERITIHPYALALYKDAIYCIAYETHSKQVITLQLDRMCDTAFPSDERFELPRDFKLDDFVQGQFGLNQKTRKIITGLIAVVGLCCSL